MTDSWVSSVGTVTPRQIRQEQSSFRERTPRYEIEKVGFRDNRHVVTCERQLTVGIDRRNDRDGRTLVFRLGAISTLLASGAEAILQESREGLDAEKQN